MQLKIVAALLFWWFAFASMRGGATTVGPFRDRADCDQARDQMSRAVMWGEPYAITTCWWDGR